MIKANDPGIKSWLDVDPNHDFSIQNLPFGIFKTNSLSPRVGVALGDNIIDLVALSQLGYLKPLNFDESTLSSSSLNEFMLLGKGVTRELRNRLSFLFNRENDELQSRSTHISNCLVPIEQATMMMPVNIGDYTDFYSSIEHATNVGTMFRDPNNALLPNWRHIPVGYHGRASSIILSGQDIHRPKGQQKPNENEPPVYGPCRLLDFELEMAFVTYQGKALGQSISTAEAEDYIFGMCLFNDWSARDIQKWEYVPLGPFLGKNFASSISPWIITLDALQPFKVSGPVQEPKVLPYLEYTGEGNYNIDLQVDLKTENGDVNTICKSNYQYMYWNMRQQLAHHTINGCNINVGDMMASGTISGSTPDSYGSMLELSWKGTKPIKLSDGTERKFIQDGDSVIMKGAASKDGVRVGFGSVETKVLPAI
ncbi:MAG: fumarylacetoacetase [Flavobacteriales bacterium]|nr:fumarylacetoacetase [Flavobacteriales bacterium]